MNDIIARIASRFRPRHATKTENVPRVENTNLTNDTLPSPYDSSQPFKAPNPSRAAAAAWNHEALIEQHWRSHPRFLFLKFMTPHGSNVLDVGSGAGGLSCWKEWMAPDRSDIKLFGVDLVENAHRSRYEGFEISDLNAAPIPFEGIQFDGMLVSHVLEHLKDPEHVLSKLHPRVKRGGLVYVETPTPASKDLPRQPEFVEHGWPMIISNFYDDATHIETYSLASFSEMAQRAGFAVETSGVISNPYLADLMIHRGISDNDGEMLLYGYWLATGWAQYMVLKAT